MLRYTIYNRFPFDRTATNNNDFFVSFSIKNSRMKRESEEEKKSVKKLKFHMKSKHADDCRTEIAS